MTTAADATLVDTSILVYSTVPVAPWHTEAQAKLTELKAAGVELWLSRQVLREYLGALSRPQSYTGAQPMADLIVNVTQFQADYLIAEDGPKVTAELIALLKIIPCGGKQVHDANIVATMLTHGISRILTHNVVDFRRFSSHITVLPLVP